MNVSQASKSQKKEEIASWEKHTKGIGSKLLQKFGFNGKLGVNESGLEKPIEVVVRPTNEGLGFAKSEGQEKSKLSKPNIVGSQREKSKARVKAAPTLPNRAKAKRYASENHSIEQLLDSTIISDDEFEAEDFELERSQERFSLETTTMQSGVSQTERKRNALEVSSAVLQNTLALKETSILKKSKRVTNLDSVLSLLNEMNRFISSLEKWKSKNTGEEAQEEDDEEEKLSSLVDEFKQIQNQTWDIFRRSEEEFMLFGVSRCISTMFFHFLRFGITQGTGSTTGNSSSRLLSNYEGLSRILKEVQAFLESAPSQIQAELRSEMTSWILEKTVLAELWRFISKEFNPVFHVQLLIDYLDLVQPFLTERRLEEFVETTIVPRLLVFVQSWRFDFDILQYSIVLPSLASFGSQQPVIHGRDDYFLFHHWILPFLRFSLSGDWRIFQTIFPEIRRRIVTILRDWKIPEKGSAATATTQLEWLTRLLLPWRDVFDQNSFLNLFQRAVLPKLQKLVQSSPAVLREESNVRAVLALLLVTAGPRSPQERVDMMLISDFFAMAFSEVFREIRSNLEDADEEVVGSGSRLQRLIGSCLLVEEALKTLHLWRKSLPANLFQDSSSSQTQLLFESGLALLERHLLFLDASLSPSKQKISADQIVREIDVFLLKLNRLKQRPVSLYQKPVSTSIAADKEAPRSSTTAVPSSLTTVKDMLSAAATRSNVEFLPARSQTSGLSSYRFGSLQIYLDNSVIRYHEKKSGSWIPITIEELEKLVQQQQ